MTPTRKRNAEALYDHIASRPLGTTWEEVQADLGFKSRTYFFRAVRDLRMILAFDDTITLICEPRGPRETWLYRLVGNPAEAYGWQSNRISDLEARLATVLDVSTSVAANADERTTVGKKAVRIKSTISYLLGELALIAEEH